MSTATDLNHCFLIASPTLEDDYFHHALIYLHTHNADDGALGIVVNKPLDFKLDELLERADIETTSYAVKNQPVFSGGPVNQDTGFVLQIEPKSSLFNSPTEILHAIAKEEGPEEYMVVLGFSTWSYTQLTEEIKNGDWLVAPFESNILFNTSINMRWEAAAKLIGVDISKLSGLIGHA